MTTTRPSPFHQARAEAFAGRFRGVLNDGALCLMIAIGHRTGLLDAMRDLPPSTSADIATHSGLDERYVREWLGAMVTARVVEIDPATLLYGLPPEHAAFLTRQAKADNMAAFAQYISILGSVENDIVECFRTGGGVPYDRFPRFQEVMAEGSGQFVVSSLESHVLPLVPGLAGRLAAGIRVLDLGCGRGVIMTRLATLFPKSLFTGMDLSGEATDFGRRTAAAADLKNADFVRRDLSDFDESADPEAFDLVTTFDAVHDQARPLGLLKGIHRTLAADGIYMMQDIKASSHMHENIGHPLGTALYTISCMHCMTVSLAQGGEGLGAMWGEQKVREYVERAGFQSIEKHELADDIQNDWYIVRK